MVEAAGNQPDVIKIVADVKAAETPLERLEALLKQVGGQSSRLKEDLKKVYGSEASNALQRLKADLGSVRIEMAALAQGDLGAARRGAGIRGLVNQIRNETRDAIAAVRVGRDQIKKEIDASERILNRKRIAGDVLRGNFVAPDDINQLRRYRTELQALYNTAFDRAGRGRDASDPLAKLGAALDQVNGKIKEHGATLRSQARISDEYKQKLTQAAEATRSLGVDVAQSQLSADQRARRLGRSAIESDLRRAAATGSLEGVSDQELRVAQRAARLEVERQRGKLEGLKAEQASTAEIEKQLERLTRAHAVDSAVTKEVERRTAARKQDTPAKHPKSADEQWDATFARVNAGGGARMLELQARLLANYLAINSAMNALSFATKEVVELDNAFRQLQAVAGVTDTQMTGLKDTVLKVAEETKFSGTQVAEAATTLAQAGFSVQEVQDSLRGVALLATATGTDLAQSVDVATSVIGVFNMRAAEMTQIAQTVTAALNQSKLTMDKLALGLQYSANIAADTGISFTELTAALAAMANSGIRSGSTMGTGFRQLVIELQDPSEKLKQRLREMGVGLDEIDIKSQGFVGVMKRLQQAGFTTADALKTMETRSAAAFAALSKSTDDLLKMQEAFLLTNAATQANEIQMRSLKNVADNLGGAFTSFATVLTQDAVYALRDFLKGVTEVFSALSQLGPVLTTVGTALLSLGLGVVATSVVNLAKNLTVVKAALAAFGTTATATAGTSAAAAGITAAGTAAGTTATFLSRAALAATAFMRALGPVGVAVSAATLVFTLFSGAAERTRDALDTASANLEKARSTTDTYKSSLDAVTAEYERAEQRRERLTKAEQAGAKTTDELRLLVIDAKLRFGDLGFQMDENTATFEGYRAELKRVMDLLQTKFADSFIDQINKIDDRIRALKDEQQNLQGDGILGRRMKDAFAPGMSFVQRLGAGVSNLGIAAGDVLGFGKLEQSAGLGKLMKSSAGPNVQALLADLDADKVKDFGRVQETINAVKAAKDELGQRLTDEVVKQLEGIRDNLKAQSASAAERRVLENKQLGAKFKASPTGQAIEEEVAGLRRMMADANKELARDTSADDREQKYKDFQKKFQDARSKLTAVTSKLTGQDLEAFVASGLSGDLENITHEAELRGKELADQARKGRIKVLDKEIQTIKEEIDTIQAEVRAGVNKDVAGAKARIAALNDQLASKTIRREELKVEDDKDLRADPSMGAKAVDLTRRKVALEGQQNLLEMDRVLNRSRDQILKELNQPKARDAITQALGKSENKLRRGLFDINLRGAQADADIEYLSNQPGSNAYITSRLERERREITKQADRDSLKALQERSAELKTQHSAATEAAGREAKKLEELKGKYEDTTLSVKQRNYVAEQYNKTLTEYESIQDQVIQIEGAQQQAIEDVATAQAKVDAQTKKLGNSFSQTWDTVWENWRESSGAYKDLNETFGDFASTALEAGQNSLANFFSDTISGAETVGEAFQGMAVSFADAILKMATNQMAASFFEMIGGKGSGGTGTGIFSSIISGIGSMFGFTNGGIRYFATGGGDGLVPGQDFGRDTVPAAYRPGEFVVRKAAVDAVGADFLRDVNARGAAALQAVAPLPDMSRHGDSAGQGGGTVNVWVVAPDEKPAPGPRDIVATISQDILTGGSTKKLIKQVAMGSI